MKITPRFKSGMFTWKGNRGIASLSDLEVQMMPYRFEVVSGRTGHVKTFELDQNDPGFQDGWDGECWCFTSNEWDEVKLTVLNS